MYYKQEDQVFKVNDDGRGRPKLLEETDIIKVLRSQGVSLADMEFEYIKFINNLPEKLSKEAIKIQEFNDKLEVVYEKMAAVKKINPFKHFKLIESSNSNKLLVMIQIGNKIEILGTLDVFNPREIINILHTFTPEIVTQLKQELAPYLSPKDPSLVSNQDLIQSCINILDPITDLERVKIDNEDIHPATIEGCEVVSLVKIPYTLQSSSYDQLNPLLREFLGRVDNHKHLCAIFWGQITGKFWPYICYLYGKDGREGKTSFINMLSRITNSYANLTEDGKFVFAALYGKAIIMVPENERSRLVSSRTVKAITGGNLLSIEEKGKKAFSGKIRGTIIVDANVPLNISGKGFETERLRYFIVKSHNIPKHDRLSPEEYTKALDSTRNEFLNYCRQCCEELMTNGGMLQEPDNHEELMNSLADEEQNYEYKQILTKICAENGLKLIVNSSTEVGYILSLAKKASINKQAFYSNSFKNYLEKEHGIHESNKMFIGIGKEISKGTYFTEPKDTLENYKTADK